MLRAGHSLEHGLGAAQAMFGNFPPAEALRALTYFEGGDLARIGPDDRNLLIRSVQDVNRAAEVPVISRHLGGPPPPGPGGMPPMGYGLGG